MSDLPTLITRVRSGDRRAFGEIVTRFQQMAVGYATAQLGDAHVAQDAAQEAFLAAFVDLDQLREPAAFPGWFRRIVLKQCDRIRRRQRFSLVPLEEDQWEARVEPLSGLNSGLEPLSSLERDDRRQMLAQAIQRLPEPERAPVTLFYLKQYSQAEVAKFLEIPASTVNNRIHSARKHLKQELLEMAEQEGQSRPADTAFVGRVEEQIEAMTSLHSTLTAPIRESLIEPLGEDVKVRVVSVKHDIGLRVVGFFPYPCCTYSFQPKDSQGRICFDINMELVACIVGRQIGRGDDIRVADVGQIAQHEFEHISRVAGRIMREIVALWSEVVEMEVIKPEVETNNCYVMDGWIPAHDPMFHVRFEVLWDNRVSHIDLAYPAPSLAAGLAQIRSAAA
ncbi:MAG: sigma-70 family RNA polymerase sigma factor [Gemmatimonadetes bacterium]|jgi:RNA polymerase sigma factor (sigma-70 family)|nr:sigma-70 family RNA polymerase sigma factor [Gemmatimonadota bacterium]MBT5589340.1 sigma-70 family RNA polymerase sigma factor [Gemmatimonadota bacterium]MBT5963846.1 sigma-70 family RNA polymerase sigma factor [Gemmatimonadota bacterium]MBT6628485.1 sigma-70 family RNA polymerase sigma factor [Gemmatimonadota bacterium]MBT7454165.1 sigma-70 family RNA polymerase sigma factor [Gemmatimonadota bacterium]